MSKILVPESGSRSGFRFMEDLEAIESVSVVPADIDPFCSAAYHREFRAVPKGSEPRFGEVVAELVDHLDINAIAPTVHVGAAEAAAVLADRSLFGLPLPVHYRYHDKYQVGNLSQVGLQHPTTVLLSEVDHFEPSDAVVVKPRNGKGSAGVLMELAGSDSLDVLRRSNADARIVQRRVFGQQFTVDILAGEHDIRCYARAVKKHGPGGADQVVELYTPATRLVEECVGAWASDQEFLGLYNVEVILDERNQLWLIDLNLRVSAGFKFTDLLLRNTGSRLMLAEAWHRLVVRQDLTVWDELAESDEIRQPIFAYDTPNGVRCTGAL